MLTLNYVSADGRSGGNDTTVPYDDLLKELKSRIETRRKEVIEEKSRIDDKEAREAAITVAMNNFKIVIYGEKALRGGTSIRFAMCAMQRAFAISSRLPEK